MNAKNAVQLYHFSEQSKTEMMTASKLILLAGDLAGSEQNGARKLCLQYLDTIRANLGLANRMTEAQEFINAEEIIAQVVSLLENEAFDSAASKLGEAISQATTPAQNAWDFLKANEFI